MNTKHTPGPWHVEPTTPDSTGRLFDWRTPISSRGPYVCSIVQAGSRALEEADANASLIAAAPDMFEALKDLVSALHGRDQCSVTRAAIAAAVAIIEKVEK